MLFLIVIVLVIAIDESIMIVIIVMVVVILKQRHSSNSGSLAQYSTVSTVSLFLLVPLGSLDSKANFHQAHC